MVCSVIHLADTAHGQRSCCNFVARCASPVGCNRIVHRLCAAQRQTRIIHGFARPGIYGIIASVVSRHSRNRQVRCVTINHANQIIKRQYCFGSTVVYLADIAYCQGFR